MSTPTYIYPMKHQKGSQVDTSDVEAIRRNIAMWRKKQGLSQVELAAKMGVTQRVISYYENEARTISLDALTAIAKALVVPVRKLLENEEGPAEPLPLPKSLQKRLEQLHHLSPKGQRSVQDFIDMVAKAEGAIA